MNIETKEIESVLVPSFRGLYLVYIRIRGTKEGVTWGSTNNTNLLISISLSWQPCLRISMPNSLLLQLLCQEGDGTNS